MNQTATMSELAIDILERTDDGHKLFQTEENVERWGRNGDGWQLAFLQDAVNGEFNEKGQEVFRRLHRQVLLGDFLYPAREFLEKFCADLKGGAA